MDCSPQVSAGPFESTSFTDTPAYDRSAPGKLSTETLQ